MRSTPRPSMGPEAWSCGSKGPPEAVFFDAVKGPSGVRKQRSYVGMEFLCGYGVRTIYKE